MTQATDTDRSVVRGVLKEKSDERIVLSIPNTNYQVHLAIESPIEESLNKRISGHIVGRAKRVDTVNTGGPYVEPVIGRPRRLQGMIIGSDAKANTLTVYCGIPVTVTLTMDQKAADFEPQQLVSFDVERGATFKPL